MRACDTSETTLRGTLDLLRRLSRAQIPEAEAAVREARQRAEALDEIDEAAAGRACPHCGGDRRAKWGRARTGVQRWPCKGCRRTWSGLTGTPVAGLHQPALRLDAVKNMMGDTPLSCRKLAACLGVSRHTAWRWRMKLLAALPSGPAELLQGIVEADETFQRESRKGSREWVRRARAAAPSQASAEALARLGSQGPAASHCQGRPETAPRRRGSVGPRAPDAHARCDAAVGRLSCPRWRPMPSCCRTGRRSTSGSPPPRAWAAG